MSAPTRRHRGLSEDEAALWAQVAQSVDPIFSQDKARRIVAAAAAEIAATAEPHSAPDAVARASNVRASQPSSAPAAQSQKPSGIAAKMPSWRPSPQKSAQSKQAPELPAIETRKARRIARGHVPLDAVLDLHGLRQHEAQSALLGFLVRAQRGGMRFVKVITGKGTSERVRPDAGTRSDAHWQDIWSRGEEGGVLRRMVPQWLGSPEMRGYVAGTRTAGRGHGGDGALYIQIRQIKRAPPAD